jgi:hypothetical protein
VSGQLSGVYAQTQDGSGPIPLQTVTAAEAALQEYQAVMAQVKPLLP